MQVAPEADFGFPSYYASSDDNLGYLVIPAADEPGEPDVYVVHDGTNDAPALFAVPSERGSSRAVENGNYEGPVPHARYFIYAANDYLSHFHSDPVSSGQEPSASSFSAAHSVGFIQPPSRAMDNSNYEGATFLIMSFLVLFVPREAFLALANYLIVSLAIPVN